MDGDKVLLKIENDVGYWVRVNGFDGLVVGKE